MALGFRGWRPADDVAAPMPVAGGRALSFGRWVKRECARFRVHIHQLGPGLKSPGILADERAEGLPGQGAVNRENRRM
jgi:hypothetical protein